MRTALVLAATVLLGAAGCGGNGRHAAIADYITRVDDIEHAMSLPLQEVSSANRGFAHAPSNPKLERELATSVKTMRRLRRRLAGVQPPREAAKLQAQLLELVDREVALAVEVHSVAVFVPRYQAALRPLPAATTALQKTLGGRAKGLKATQQLDAQKASALDAYAATVTKVAGDLRRLDPPPVWQPTYQQQLASLTGLAGAGRALAGAIRLGDAPAIPLLLQRFDAAAASNRSIVSQKRAIAAVHQYNDRIRAVIALAQRVQRTRAVLERQYG